MRLANYIWIAGVGLIAALGLALKFSVASSYLFPDIPAANRTIQAKLSEAGFQIAPQRFTGDWRVAGRRGDCRLLAGVTDDLGQNFTMWQHAARGGGDLRYHYRGATMADFPRLRGPLNAQIQMLLSRLGMETPRDAIVATIAKGRCAGAVPDLSRITMPMRPA